MTSNPFMVGILGMLGLFGLIAIRIPIGIAMVIVGLAGFALQVGWTPALTILVNDPASTLTSIDLATVPLFLLMGTFTSLSGFSSDIFAVAAAFLGHRRGGLAYATIAGCAAFGAVCGSSTATAATFTKIALPEMLRRGYDPGYAAGSIAAGGALKSLIPPSLIMILYCIASNTFILDLFVAAVIPAMLVVALNLLAIWLTAARRKESFPVVARVGWDVRHAAVRRAFPAFVLVAIVFGGLYSGIFTVNEAACVAAVTSLVFAILRGRINWPTFLKGLQQTAGISIMTYVILFGANIFAYFMTVAHVPDALVTGIGHLPLPPLAVIVLMLVFYLVLGSVFDEIAAMLITLPFALPIIVHFGYDPLWWGVINVVIIEIGLIHPPLGLIVFILHGMAPSISLRAIYRGVVPFIAADLVLLAVLTVFPALATWLPQVLNH